MTTFQRFCARCKARHDFADRIQVRYQPPAGEHYDTWVSGEEVMQRLHAEANEQRLRGLSRLDWEQIQEARRRLPEEGKQKLHDHLKDRLADGVEDFLGGNVIGDSLADAVRGRDGTEDPQDAEKQQWQARLHHTAFRDKVLELAWINLRGSLPEEEQVDENDNDWV